VPALVLVLVLALLMGGCLPLQKLLLWRTLLVGRKRLVGLVRASGLCEGRYLRYRTRIMFGFT
jgi:hypothetical protein